MMILKKPSLSVLYQILSATFCVIVVISNILSAKMVQLPYFWNLSIPAGLITYPLTFLLSDLVTEIFGPKKAKLMVYIALAMNFLSFGFIQLALILPSSIENEQIAFQSVLGLSGLRIFSSLTAYLVAQLVDIQLYSWIKKFTGPRYLWMRNNGSTCASQIADTLIIDIIYLYWGLAMPLTNVVPIMCISYAYKAFFSLAMTPLFYLCIYLVKTNWKILLVTSPSKPTLEAIYE